MTEDRELIKLYRGCGNMATKSRSSKAHIALAQLEDYVNGTIIQTNRVSNAKEKSIFGKEAHSKILQTITKEIKERKKEMAEIINSHDNYSECLQLSLDVHQLLICIDKVQNLVKYIAKEDGDPKLEALWNKVEPQFLPFNEARNYLEHIEQRIRDKVDDEGLSGTDGQILQFRDREGNWKEIKIDDTGLKLVQNTYDELISILRSRPDHKVGQWKSRDEPTIDTMKKSRDVLSS